MKDIIFKIVLMKIIVSLIFNKKKHNVIIVNNKEEMNNVFKVFDFIFKLERFSQHDNDYRFDTSKKNNEKSHNVRIYTKDFKRIHGQRADIILSNSVISKEFTNILKPNGGTIYFIKTI